MDTSTIIILMVLWAILYVFFMPNSSAEGATPEYQIIPILYTEYLQGNYYLYDFATNEFVCQSETLDGLAHTLNNYKKIRAAVVFTKSDTDYAVSRMVRSDVFTTSETGYYEPRFVIDGKMFTP